MNNPDPQYQDRIVVLGSDYTDARLHAERHPALEAHDAVLVAAASHQLTILGGVAGMHIAQVFVTPGAHRGPNYELAREALQRCLARTGGAFTNLTGEGSTYASL